MCCSLSVCSFCLDWEFIIDSMNNQCVAMLTRLKLVGFKLGKWRKWKNISMGPRCYREILKQRELPWKKIILHSNSVKAALTELSLLLRHRLDSCTKLSFFILKTTDYLTLFTQAFLPPFYLQFSLYFCHSTSSFLIFLNVSSLL